MTEERVVSGEEPDAYRDEHGRMWLNLRKRRDGMPGVFDATPACVPLWFVAAPSADATPSEVVERAIVVNRCSSPTCTHCSPAVPEAGAGGLSEAAVIRDVLAERKRQVAKGYTPEHDDHHHSLAELAAFARERLDRSFRTDSRVQQRALLVQAAALAIAAVQKIDRVRRVTASEGGGKKEDRGVNEIAELLKRFSHPRAYAGDYYVDFARRIITIVEEKENG